MPHTVSFDRVGPAVDDSGLWWDDVSSFVQRAAEPYGFVDGGCTFHFPATTFPLIALLLNGELKGFLSTIMEGKAGLDVPWLTVKAEHSEHKPPGGVIHPTVPAIALRKTGDVEKWRYRITVINRHGTTASHILHDTIYRHRFAGCQLYNNTSLDLLPSEDRDAYIRLCTWRSLRALPVTHGC